MYKVYVYWYGNLLEGELLETYYLGMRQVRIPMNGHHVTALFTAAHIYPTPADAKLPSRAASAPVSGFSMQSPSDCLADDNTGAPDASLDSYIESHWDDAHNHLRVDALDTFYQLWRAAHGGSIAVSGLSMPSPCDGRSPMPTPRVGTTTPAPSASSAPAGFASGIPATKKLTRRQLLSTNAITYPDATTQTSIFDLL